MARSHRSVGCPESVPLDQSPILPPYRAESAERCDRYVGCRAIANNEREYIALYLLKRTNRGIFARLLARHGIGTV